MYTSPSYVYINVKEKIINNAFHAHTQGVKNITL